MKTIKLLIALLITTSIYAQKYIDISNLYSDKISIDKIINHCSKERYKVLIYQPSLDVIDFTSILLVNNGKHVSFWKIKNDSILRSGKIKNDSIFSYRNYYLTGSRKSEDRLKFIPPIACCNAIIYFDYKYKFYFEEGYIPGTYSPSNKFLNYRSEWTRIIKNEIDSIIRN